MVWFSGPEPERAPLSVILPRLYLGGESDVTQDRLTSLDISYVLSVSRCSPQPAFLPYSRYLRIPIDDSLSDDLLPWIPQALHFIDSARSSGASVLVHCGAGISRSPALTVAYVMYSLDLNLDHAYRFVKERRPSISPNLNFLGQLQHFQGTLRQKASSTIVHEPSLHNTSQDVNMGREVLSVHPTLQGPSSMHTNDHRDLPFSGNTNYKIQKAFNSNLSQNCQALFVGPALCLSVPVEAEPSVSLLEKRKSLTLSLTPLSSPSSDNTSKTPTASKTVLVMEVAEQYETNPQKSHKERSKCSKAEAKEALLSPLSLTLNKLLTWGERLLFASPVRMGQPALPYRC